jgi:pullulanase/glycogen debranching enzyme
MARKVAKKKTAAEKTTTKKKAATSKKTTKKKVVKKQAAKKTTKKKVVEKKAPKKKTRRKKKTAEDVRLKATWGVFSQTLKQVASFEYHQKKQALDKCAALSKSGKPPHFVRVVKEPIEEPLEEEG